MTQSLSLYKHVFAVIGGELFEFCSATWYMLFSASVYVVHYCVMIDGNEVIELDYVFLHPFSPCLLLYILISSV